MTVIKMKNPGEVLSWTVRAVFAHNGGQAWEKIGVMADTGEEALEIFLNDWMPTRPVTIMVWIESDKHKEAELRVIGLN